MVFKVARGLKCFFRSREIFISGGHWKAYGIMTDIEVDRASSLPSIATDDQSRFQQSLSVSQDQRYSSNVQSTPDIEKKYVHRVYDAIAPHFSSTRFAKWPKVATFLNSLPHGSLVLDAGCGNGKYLGLNPDCFFIGCDISGPLINICAGRGFEVMVADAVNLPYRSDFGDAAISIAVLHHLSTESRRKKAIDELVRVVKKGGLVLITVWAVEQEDSSLVTKWTPLNHKYAEEWIGSGSPHVRCPSNITLESIPETEENGFGGCSKDSEEPSKEKMRENIPLTLEREDGLVTSKNLNKNQMEVGSVTSKCQNNVENQWAYGSMTSKSWNNTENQQEYFVPWHLPYHRAEVSGASASALANGLARKDDKKGAVVYNRYYHVFIEGELERLVSGIDNAVILDRFFDKSNWCIILKKT